MLRARFGLVRMLILFLILVLILNRNHWNIKATVTARGPCLRGVYCISRSQERFRMLQKDFRTKFGALPVERWHARNSYATASSNEVRHLIDSGLVLPQTLPYSLVKTQLEQDDYNQWREGLRREDRWEDVRHSRDAPRRPDDGWIAGLDHTPESLARAVSHLELWSDLANRSGEDDAFLVFDEDCSFMFNFTSESLMERLEHVPLDWHLVFLGGVDLLGTQAQHQVATGVRRFYPWFLSRTAPYMITRAGARKALETCTPLRWRLDCQLAGYHWFMQKEDDEEERLRKAVPEPVAYCLVPPMATSIEQEFDHGTPSIVEQDEARLNEELDTVVAWAMRLTDVPVPLPFWCPDRTVEGHTNMIPESRRVMRELAQAPGIQRILEIGFNGGHSALRWLLYSDATVHAFDLGAHAYARPAAAWLAARFPGRLKVTWGDSMEELPKYVGEHPETKYELIFVDGGHDINIARSDLKYSAMLANPAGHRILMDDTNIEGPEKAWDELLASGDVVQLARYHGRDHDADWDKATWGFAVGYYTASAVEGSSEE
eukprot:CAMPEP_0117485656 /NCGR_PEP_ID=MMETSP0784-20121206/15076_1 /TAXON_ID=39447 /ORGANISM="" /LENGTH=545 /DNA_ID=CAMNT_0005280247 /DNA_START=160 /DNA_END=1797 /DNA_ORIENTATION=-